MNIDQTVATAVADLDLGEHFTFDALTTAIRHQRHHAIRVAEIPELGEKDGLCALVIFLDDADLIVHAHTDSALHTQQFVLHEFAHIILGHCETGRYFDTAPVDMLFPDLPAGLRLRALARSSVDNEEEIAAESLADYLAAGIRGSAFADTSYTEIFG